MQRQDPGYLYEVTRERLLAKYFLRQIYNIYLNEAASDCRFQFKGEGGIKQFIRDNVATPSFRTIGFKKLGIQNDSTAELQKDQRSTEDFHETVRSVLQSIFGDQAEAVIAAHSQKAAYLAVNVMTAAFIGTSVIVMAPQDFDTNISIDAQNQVYMYCCFNELTLMNTVTEKATVLPGPIIAKFNLVLPGLLHREPYYELEKFQTDNIHAFHILNGEKVNAAEIVEFYFNPARQSLIEQSRQQIRRNAYLQDELKTHEDLYKVQQDTNAFLRSQNRELKKLEDLPAVTREILTHHLQVKEAVARERDDALKACAEARQATQDVRAAVAIDKKGMDRQNALLREQLEQMKQIVRGTNNHYFQELCGKVKVMKAGVKKDLFENFIRFYNSFYHVNRDAVLPRADMLEHWVNSYRETYGVNPFITINHQTGLIPLFNPERTASAQIFLAFLEGEEVQASLREIMEEQSQDEEVMTRRVKLV